MATGDGEKLRQRRHERRSVNILTDPKGAEWDIGNLFVWKFFNIVAAVMCHKGSAATRRGSVRALLGAIVALLIGVFSISI